MLKKFPSEFEREVVTVGRRGDLTLLEVAGDLKMSEGSASRWFWKAEIFDVVREGLKKSDQSGIVQLRRDKRRWANKILCRARVLRG